MINTEKNYFKSVIKTSIDRNDYYATHADHIFAISTSRLSMQYEIKKFSINKESSLVIKKVRTTVNSSSVSGQKSMAPLASQSALASIQCRLTEERW